MLKKFAFVLGCCLFTIGAASASTMALRDSVGVRNQNGKTYIVHKVEPKETLYALSRKYGVSVAQIVEANQNIEKSITIGQMVLVPMKPRATSSGATATNNAQPKAGAGTSASTASVAVAGSGPAANRTYSVDGKGNKMHTVKPSQTLYSISKLHGVTIDQIKKWNNLSSNSIEIGQNLIVGTGVKATGQVNSSSQIYVPERDDAITASTQPAAPATTPASPITASVKEAPAVKTEEAEEKTAKATEYISRVNEAGMAEQIDAKSDANKFLALHKTAPVGTIMAVKNPSNDQTVYVRVIGKLPATGDNDKLVVKLSKKACQQIGVTDKRFRVELSYMP